MNYEEVLSFWFGNIKVDPNDNEQLTGYDEIVSYNYKRKWFPQLIDPVDRYIDEHFGSLLAGRTADQLRDLADAWQAIGGLRGLLAFVILCDQFPRHIHRHAHDRSDKLLVTGAAALQQTLQYLQRASSSSSSSSSSWWDSSPVHGDDGQSTATTTNIEANGALEAACRMVGLRAPLSGLELAFLLMPLRHSPSVARLRAVMAAVDARLARDESDTDVIRKFRRATLRRLADADAQEKSAVIVSGAANPADDDILEFHEFQLDADDEAAHLFRQPLVRSIREFVRKQVAAAASPTGQAQRPHLLLVSLSGGVDSMVLAYVLLRLQEDMKRRRQPCPYRLAAAHIDYANRAESRAEARFVEDWARRHGIEFHQRRIDEVRRGGAEMSRSEYELYTRNIRFDLYRDVFARHTAEALPSSSSSSLVSSSPICSVLFGHHKGDVEENVISNMMRGASLLDLAGMGPVGRQNGVEVWRPMLAHPKDDVFAVAHRYGVPYFRDTTPRWSTRGKLRRQLLPLVADVYGDGFADNLSSLAADSRQAGELCRTALFEPVWRAAVVSPLAVCIADCRPHSQQPLFFWKEILKHLCEQVAGIGKFPEVALTSQFIPRLRGRGGAGKLRPGFLNLKRGLLAQLDANGAFAFFRPEAIMTSGVQSAPDFSSSFSVDHPCRRRHPPADGGDQPPTAPRTRVTHDKTIPWTITVFCTCGCFAEVPALTGAPGDDSKSTQFQLRLTDVCSGRVVYSLRGSPRFCWWMDPARSFMERFGEHRRPQAWRALDRRLTDWIPLVSPAESAHSDTSVGWPDIVVELSCLD